MDVQKESSVGIIVCGVDAVRVRWRSVQQFAERAERSDATGELLGDDHCHRKRNDDEHASDSIYSGVVEIAAKSFDSTLPADEVRICLVP